MTARGTAAFAPRCLQGLNRLAGQAKRCAMRLRWKATVNRQRASGVDDMIRFFLRFVGLLLLALAFIFLVYDGIRSISDGGILLTKASDIWNILNDRTLAAFQTWVEGRADVRVWQAGIAPVLNQPAWLVAGVLGAILTVLGRKKKPLIGYARD